MIGSFTIYDCSGFAGALGWGPNWRPEGGLHTYPEEALRMDEGYLFSNVGLAGQLWCLYVGGPGVFPEPGPYPNTTALNVGPFGPFIMENGKSYCINAQTGVLTEKASEIGTLLTSIMPLIMIMMVMMMLMPMFKGMGEGFKEK